MKELKDVGNWYSLGFYLGVTPKNLEYLKQLALRSRSVLDASDQQVGC